MSPTLAKKEEVGQPLESARNDGGIATAQHVQIVGQKGDGTLRIVQQIAQQEGVRHIADDGVGRRHQRPQIVQGAFERGAGRPTANVFNVLQHLDDFC